MKLIINKSILILFNLLLVSIVFTANVDSSANISNIQENHYQFLDQISPATPTFDLTGQASPISKVKITDSDTVIFVENTTELNFFKIFYASSIIRSYDNLMALKINLPLNTVKTHPQAKHLSMFSSIAFENLNIPIINNIINDINNLQLTQANDEANLLGINTLWDAGYNGTGVNVAIMDNGIDTTHPALNSKIIGNIDISTNNTIPCKDHGTAVAGIIAADQIDNNIDVLGMAYGSKFHDISFGCIGSTIAGDILAGFDYILENNATIDVVNTSFGGFAPSWDLIVEKLESAGIVLVGSAGNDGPSFHTTTTGGPGNSIYGISVGASNINGQLSPFSARGPVYNMLYKPDLIAPGININSTSHLGGYDLYSGTSFSSPLVTGGILTLISALNSLGYNWNPGVIKAGLLKTGENSTNNELLEGQGLVNFTDALNFIKASKIGSNNVPQLVALTPKNGPINYVSTIPQGMILKFPLTMVTSHPSDVTITFTGELDGITTYSTIEGTFSQSLEIQIDTNLVVPGSTLIGNVTATLNGTTAMTQLRIEIGNPMKGKIGIDLGHTYWDDFGADGIGSSNTGEMIRIAMLNGYSVEHVTDKIDDIILNDLDIFWMPDPISLMETDSPSLLEQGFQQNILYDSEIAAIVDFVNDGGSLLIDFNGLLNSSDSLSEEVLIGLNATGMNQLISNFGIEAMTIPIIEPFGHLTVDLINQSSLIGEAEKYTHYGNYLQLSGNAEAIAITNGGLITAATYTNPTTGGRVLISSSNYWMDNLGILGGYIGAGFNNRILAENTIDWLTQESRVIKTAQIITSTTISGSFIAFENKSITTTIPQLFIEGNNQVLFESIVPINHGNGTFSFTHSYSGQGIFRIIALLDSDYIVWEVIVDELGPTINPRNTNANGSRFNDENFYLIDFIVQDDISGVNPDSTIIRIENSIINADILFNEEADILTIILNAIDFQTKDLGEFYHLELSISDKNGNTSIYHYYFQIGEPIKTSVIPTSNTSTLIPNNESNNNFDQLTILIFSVLTVIIFGLLYKNYSLRKSN